MLRTSAAICLTPVYAAVQAMLLIGEKVAWAGQSELASTTRTAGQ
jgi:hypothetical protein